jgi:hypothetical protein
MEAICMKPTITLLAGLLLAGIASAGDVYVTRDAQGNPVYTDTPQTLPAQRMGIHSSSTDPTEVQARVDQQAKQLAAEDRVRAEAAARSAVAAKAQAMTVEDRAQRCAEARERYQAMMQGYRIYEMTPDGERRYLTSEEIDAGRVSAKQVMDEFCGEQ